MCSNSFEIPPVNHSFLLKLDEIQKKLAIAEGKTCRIVLVRERLSTVYDTFKELPAELNKGMEPAFQDMSSCIRVLIKNQGHANTAADLKKKIKQQKHLIQKLQKKQLQSLQEAFTQTKKENAELLLQIEQRRIERQDERRQFLESLRTLTLSQNNFKKSLEELTGTSKELTLSVNKHECQQAKNSEELLNAVTNELNEQKKTEKHFLKELSREIDELRKELASSLSTENRRNSRGFVAPPVISKAD